MYSHYTKEEYPALAITVVGLMILSGVVLLFGAVSAVYLMLAPAAVQVDILTFIILTFGSIVASFLIFSIAEVLQLIMKIELNTRKGPVRMPGKSRK